MYSQNQQFPINLNIGDNQIKQERVETDRVYPRTINDSIDGGQAIFVLKHRGYLSPDSRLIIPVRAPGGEVELSPTGGIFALCKRATIRCGSTVILQSQDINLLMSQQNLCRSIPHRHNVDRPLHGVMTGFETASCGLKGFSNYSDDTATVSKADRVLYGKMRVIGDEGYEYYEDFVPENPITVGQDTASSQSVPKRVLRTSNSDAYKLDTTVYTPYCIDFHQLFPGFMGQRLELPVQLISHDQQIELEIVFCTRWAFQPKRAMCTQARYFLEYY